MRVKHDQTSRYLRPPFLGTPLVPSRFMHIYIYTHIQYIYIYIYTYRCVCVSISIYIYIYTYLCAESHEDAAVQEERAAVAAHRDVGEALGAYS